MEDFSATPTTSVMTDLYPSPGHSTSPSMHNVPHNPYPSHTIYPPSNLMQMAPPTSSPLNQLGYKDSNDNTVTGAAHHGAYAAPTTTNSIVTMLGPNSGKFQRA